MKKPFAVGDRVRVIISAGDVQDGTIKSECPGGWKVELDDPADIVTMDADPRQMRRLVKRKPAREWWVIPHETERQLLPRFKGVSIAPKENIPGEDWIHVREVRPKK